MVYFLKLEDMTKVEGSKSFVQSRIWFVISRLGGNVLLSRQKISNHARLVCIILILVKYGRLFYSIRL